MESVIRKAFHYLVIAASVFVYGCASTATVRSIKPIEGDLSQYKNAFVAITASPYVQQNQGGLQVFQSVEAKLKNGMVAKMKASGIFQNVSAEMSSEPTESDLKIIVTVDQFIYGTKLEGLTNVLPLAGPRLRVGVELFNAKTGRKLAHFQLVATTSDSYAQADAVAEASIAEIVAKAK